MESENDSDPFEHAVDLLNESLEEENTADGSSQSESEISSYNDDIISRYSTDGETEPRYISSLKSETEFRILPGTQITFRDFYGLHHVITAFFEVIIGSEVNQDSSASSTTASENL